MIVILVFPEVDSKYPDEIKKKTKNLPFCPENKISPQDKFSKDTKDMKPVHYTQNRELMRLD